MGVGRVTIADAKSKLVTWANSQVGYTESANNWNKYAENEDLRQLYGWKPQNAPWCDSFVDAGFCICFGLELASKLTYQPIGKGSAACRYSAGFYSAHEAFFQSPEVGDQVFFFVDGGINHTGIVVGISGKTITTVEGNSGDMVRRNSYTLGSSAIAGYGRPDWNAVLTAEDKPIDEKPVTAEIKVKGLPMLQRGDKSEVVRAAQILLIGRKCSCGIWGADGDFGNGTMAAVKAFQHRTNESARQTVLVEDYWRHDMELPVRRSVIVRNQQLGVIIMALPNEPHTRSEMYLNNIATGSGDIPTEPHTREEMYLDYIAKNGGGGSGGGGVLTVTNTDGTLDKTYAEIETAFLNGAKVIIHIHADATEDNPEADINSVVVEVGYFAEDQTTYFVMAFFGDDRGIYIAPSKSDYPSSS